VQVCCWDLRDARAEGNADAETGIGYPGGYRSAYSLLNGPHGHHVPLNVDNVDTPSIVAVDTSTLKRSRDNFSRYLREEHAMRALINNNILLAKCCNFLELPVHTGNPIKTERKVSRCTRARQKRMHGTQLSCSSIREFIESAMSLNGFT